VAEGSLDALETLRREAVEAARRRLAEARAELSQHEALYNEVSATRARCEQALQSERGQFGEARSVSRMRLVEERLRGLTQELTSALGRQKRAHEACIALRERVELLGVALLEAERNRRALGQVLELRRDVALKRRERTEEEQSEDAFRGRRGP
jgi:flagellar biosynthesis chaperone FliJ